MDFLLDTHTLLWYYLDDPKLSSTARNLVADPANRGFVSPATHWEVAIKIGTGKYSLTVPFAQFVQEAIHDNGFSILPIEPRHTEQVITLPKHHNDPFDRLLVTQARQGDLALVTRDGLVSQYDIDVIW